MDVRFSLSSPGSPHRQPPACPGDLYKHRAATDPPVKPGDDGEASQGMTVWANTAHALALS